MTSSTILLRAADLCEKASGGDRFEDLPERFLRRLAVYPDTGCWNWISPHSVGSDGRGRIMLAGKLMLHHRAIWTLLRGPIPAGAMLCHHCDNRRCGNPGHIYVGDGKSNSRDMLERGRHWTQQDPARAKEVGRICGSQNDWAKGDRNPKAKLSRQQVSDIASSIGSSRKVAALYGVDATTIQRIRNGKSWN